MTRLRTLHQRLHTLLWDTRMDTLPRWQAMPLSALRILAAVGRDLASGLPTLRAMSLVYTTLLSLVPLIAVSFSVLKGFGVHNQVEPMLLKLLAPLGDQGTQISAQIIRFVDNIKVGVLGSLGLALLIYTVISLIKKIESAFNYTWRITTFRSLTQRFTDYLSVVMVGPVLIFTAIGITAAVSSSSMLAALNQIEPFGSLLTLVGKLMPYVLIIAAFTFIYKLVPNTRVQLRSALAGAVVAGLLWETTGWLFARFVAGSVSYTAVYSGFAVLIVFMIWLYLSWMILLIGAAIAYYHQHPERIRKHSSAPRLSCRVREQLGLLLMQHIARGFHNGEARYTVEQLADMLCIDDDAVQHILQALQNAGLLTPAGEQCKQWIPALSLDSITLSDILEAVRSDGEDDGLRVDTLPGSDSIEAVTAQLQHSQRSTLQGRNLRDLIQA